MRSTPLEFARRVVERGGAGAVVGGAPRPALAFLDDGVVRGTRTLAHRAWWNGEAASDSRRSSARVDRLGIVEIEATSTVQVRLIAGETPRRRGTLLERLGRGQRTCSPSPRVDDRRPSARGPAVSPFPLNVERLREQHRQRTIRRWAADSSSSTACFNVVVTTRSSAAQSPAPRAHVPPPRRRPVGRGVDRRRGHRHDHAGARDSPRSATIVVPRGRRFSPSPWSAHALRGGTIVSLLIAAGILVLLVGQRRYFLATSDRSSVGRRAARGSGSSCSSRWWPRPWASRRPSAPLSTCPNFGVVFVACVERLLGQYDIILPDRVDDFIDPALLAIGVSLVVSRSISLTRPVVDRRLSLPATSSRERRLAELRAREIVRRHGRGTLDYFALRDDKQFFFFRDSLVAYAVYGGVALDLARPHWTRGRAHRGLQRLSRLRRGARLDHRRDGRRRGVARRSTTRPGLHYLYLGDEAIVDCQTFSLEGGKMKGLRQACTRLARYGYTVEFLDPSKIDPARVTAIVELISHAAPRRAASGDSP